MLANNVNIKRCPSNPIFFPANLSTLDHIFFNVVDQHLNNVDPTLKLKQNPTLDFQRGATLIQRRSRNLKQISKQR